MSTFKTIPFSKPQSFYKQGLMTCLSLCIGTAIYGLITDLSLSVMFERMFFQTFSIMFFCFTLNKFYKLYHKDDEVELDHVIEIKEKQKEAQFNF